MSHLIVTKVALALCALLAAATVVFGLLAGSSSRYERSSEWEQRPGFVQERTSVPRTADERPGENGAPAVRAREPHSVPAERGGAVIDGGQWFARRCARCHETADLALALREAPDHRARAQEWVELLASHGRTSDVVDRAIVDYLVEISGR